MAEAGFLRVEDLVAAEGRPVAGFEGACLAEPANLGPTWVFEWCWTEAKGGNGHEEEEDEDGVAGADAAAALGQSWKWRWNWKRSRWQRQAESATRRS